MSSPETAAPEEKKAKRLASLDAFRGLTIGLMILMNHPVAPDALPSFLTHPTWDGFTLADTVFPAFLFIMGVSMAFSAARRSDEQSYWRMTGHFVWRIVLLIVIGLLFNLMKYGEPLRYAGVLQRIGLAALVAWPLRRARTPWLVLAGVVLIAAHTYVLAYVSAPGVVAGTWAREGNIAGWLDTAVFGIEHTYRGAGFDPEGILGTLTAASQALFGLAVGNTMLRVWKAEQGVADRIAATLVGVGVLAVAGGLALGLWMPVNKPLWNASFTFLSTGTALLGFMAMYWVGDRWRQSWLLSPFVPMGRNALAMYIGSEAFFAFGGRIPLTWNGESIDLYRAGGRVFQRGLGDGLGSFVYTSAQVVAFGVIAWILHRRRIYIKL